MKILGIDTSQKTMTVAFLGAENILHTVEGEKNHSALLMPAIDKILKQAKVAAGEIDCFALVTGTGSFTGLRVGLATVKGLIFGRQVKMLAVNSEELLAYYESGAAQDFFEVIQKKAEQGRFLTSAEMELTYENPQTKRFLY